MIKCGKKIEIYIGQRIETKCGTNVASQYHFCPECEDKNDKAYPQGWDSYPGDICSHGVYVGGCGVDYMCFRCEMGDDCGANA